jgi:PAS domain-containing protein
MQNLIRPLKDSYYRDVLDAIPLPVFVVDDDVRIRDMNAMAASTFGLEGELVLSRRGGEVLHCLHAGDVPEGCGRGPVCNTCMIRGSVNQSLQSGQVSRRRSKVEIVTGDVTRQVELLITARRLPGDEKLVVLILEDIADLSKLKSILTVCMHCKEIQSEDRSWQAADAYFGETLGVGYSHGICPTCLKNHYPET